MQPFDELYLHGQISTLRLAKHFSLWTFASQIPTCAIGIPGFTPTGMRLLQ